MLDINGLYCQYKICESPVIVVRLREVMEAYHRRTGERLTYETLAERTGLAASTLASLATRGAYNTRLSTIDRLCAVLDCMPGDLLVRIEDDESGRE